MRRAVSLVGADEEFSVLLGYCEALLVVLVNNMPDLIDAHAPGQDTEQPRKWHVPIRPQYVAEPVLFNPVPQHCRHLLGQFDVLVLRGVWHVFSDAMELLRAAAAASLQ